MMTHEIDDLFMKVGPELVELYEAKNNLPDGKTLEQVNEEYKKVAKKNKNLRDFLAGLMASGLFLALVIFLLTLFWIDSKKDFPFVGIIPLAVFTILFMIIVTLLTRKVVKAEKTLAVSVSILEKFRTAVEGLDNPENPESIQNLLVTRAVMILDCEVKFDEVRVQKERRTWNVLHYGNFLEKEQKTLQALLDLAWESFGLNYDKAKIFNLARSHLAHVRPKA
jgi:hypothetical protein